MPTACVGSVRRTCGLSVGVCVRVCLCAHLRCLGLGNCRHLVARPHLDRVRDGEVPLPRVVVTHRCVVAVRVDAHAMCSAAVSPRILAWSCTGAVLLLCVHRLRVHHHGQRANDAARRRLFLARVQGLYCQCTHQSFPCRLLSPLFSRFLASVVSVLAGSPISDCSWGDTRFGYHSLLSYSLCLRGSDRCSPSTCV